MAEHGPTAGAPEQGRGLQGCQAARLGSVQEALARVRAALEGAGRAARAPLAGAAGSVAAARSAGV